MPLRCDCEELRQIGYCLIRAKVALEYGAGFALNKNEYLHECMAEIDKALDYTYTDEEPPINYDYDYPIGSILMHDKRIPIDKGWQLCDGTNGTPNLLESKERGVTSDWDWVTYKMKIMEVDEDED